MSADQTTADRQFCDDTSPPYDRVDETEWDDAPRNDDEEDGDGECGLGPNGQCSFAGTEWCDWDCGRLG